MYAVMEMREPSKSSERWTFRLWSPYHEVDVWRALLPDARIEAPELLTCCEMSYSSSLAWSAMVLYFTFRAALSCGARVRCAVSSCASAATAASSQRPQQTAA